MPKPSPDLDLITLKWAGTYLDGAPAKGSLQLTYGGGVMLDDDEVTPINIFPKLIVATLTTMMVMIGGEMKEVGYAEFQVPATNDPDIVGGGGTYALTENLLDVSTGRKNITFPVDVDAPGGVIWLNKIIPSTPAPGVPIQVVYWDDFQTLASRVSALELGGGGGEGGTATWSTLQGKPPTFPPSAHQHVIADVTGLQDALDNAGGGAATWVELEGKPSVFPPSMHGHGIDDLPAGMVMVARYDTTNDLWPARTTQRTDISVNWSGGTVQPVDMIDGDLWFKAVADEPTDPEPDEQAPSIPTGVTASNITETGFTLTWSTSSDNVGVAGYEVTVNDTVKAAPVSPSATITGMAPNSPHTATVRARDAAGNWSEMSEPVIVTTLEEEESPPIGATFSVFGTNPHPGVVVAAQGARATRATAFYTHGTEPIGWRSVGMRIFIPDGADIGDTALCHLWNVDVPSALPLPANATRTATMTGLVAGQWNDVTWDPVIITPGQYFWVGYSTLGGDYVTCPSTTGAFIASTETSNLVQADGGSSRPALPLRSFINNGTSGEPIATTDHFGIDVLIDKGAPA